MCAILFSNTWNILRPLRSSLYREEKPCQLGCEIHKIECESRNWIWGKKLETGLRSESSGLVKGQVGTCVKIGLGSDILLLEAAVRPSWKRTVSSIDICIIHFTINVWHTSTIGRTKPLNLNQIVFGPLIYINYHCAFQKWYLRNFIFFSHGKIVICGGRYAQNVGRGDIINVTIITLDGCIPM